MTNFFVNKGIMHQTSCVNTLQQNNIFERKHGHLLNVARTLMIQYHLPKIYCSCSIRCAYYKHASYIYFKIFFSS